MKMLKKELSFKQEIVGKLLKGKISRKEAGKLLDCSGKTIVRYLTRTAKGGLEALRDKRHSNNHKLSPKQEKDLVKIRDEGR